MLTVNFNSGGLGFKTGREPNTVSFNGTDRKKLLFRFGIKFLTENQKVMKFCNCLVLYLMDYFTLYIFLLSAFNINLNMFYGHICTFKLQLLLISQLQIISSI